MAEGCIQDASVLEALQLCRQAAKVGDMLPALQQVSYRLSSGEKHATGCANACMLWHLTCCYSTTLALVKGQSLPLGEEAGSVSFAQADTQIQRKSCMILECLSVEQADSM